MLLLDSINIDQNNCIINPTDKEDLQYNIDINENDIISDNLVEHVDFIPKNNIYITNYNSLLNINSTSDTPRKNFSYLDASIKINNYDIKSNKNIIKLLNDAKEKLDEKSNLYGTDYDVLLGNQKLLPNETKINNISNNLTIQSTVLIMDGSKLNYKDGEHINLFYNWILDVILNGEIKAFTYL